ncbi:MAG TPA: hypothetical protein VES42_28870 [Pilimelia sp.]|nr:hypothetical protein [Pilimelia sp.]
MTSNDPPRERLDFLGWLVLVLTGLFLGSLAVRAGAALGTSAAPFLGTYRPQWTAATGLAPAVAAVLLIIAARGWFDRAPWGRAQFAGYAGALAWTLALALVGGRAGLVGPLAGTLAAAAAVDADPMGYLADPGALAPGPALTVWLLRRAGLTGELALAGLLTAVGTLVVPLVAAAVRGVCGETPARRFLPVLMLAPYAVWLAGGAQAVVAVLGAGSAVAAVRASDAHRTGRQAAGWATAAGLLLGVAALYSYAVPWLGLSAACLYFARRRAALNLVTAAAALVPVLAARALGFAWADGLLAAQRDFATRVGPHRSALWWVALSLAALLLATGPPLVASMRKVRNTPGWPFLVGAGAAVLFSVLAGLARGGAEHAWLTFFPWLTVAAVAPQHQAGPPVRSPLLLVAAGAAAAVVVRGVLEV